MHVWFATRISNYGVEEPFCKLTSFYVSGALAQTDPDPCTWFNASMAYPDRLITTSALWGWTRPSSA